MIKLKIRRTVKACKRIPEIIN